MADPKKSGSEKALPSSSSSPPKVAEQPGVNEKEAEVTKGVLLDATKPQLFPKVPLKIMRHPGWRLSSQLSQFLLRVTPKVLAKDPQRLQPSNPKSFPQEK